MQMLSYLYLTSTEFTAPTVSGEAAKYLPEDNASFGAGLLQIIKKGIEYMNPSMTDAIRVCISLMAIVMLIIILNTIVKSGAQVPQLIGTVAISLALIQPSNTLIQLGVATVEKLSDYGKLLLPVMTAALAAEGGITASAGLYTATAVFNTILLSAISKLIIPLIYCYIVVSIAKNATQNQLLSNISKFMKWALTWTLKIIIYVFTGYVAITGVVNGTVDASAVKATKLALSGAVPVVGSILSDASETVLISAAFVKNSAGITGLFAILSLWIGPFLQIGVQYVFLKLTAGLCGVFGDTKASDLVKDFSSALGFLLAAVGTMCLLLLISTFCFMRGISG